MSHQNIACISLKKKGEQKASYTFTVIYTDTDNQIQVEYYSITDDIDFTQNISYSKYGDILFGDSKFNSSSNVIRQYMNTAYLTSEAFDLVGEGEMIHYYYRLLCNKLADRKLAYYPDEELTKYLNNTARPYYYYYIALLGFDDMYITNVRVEGEDLVKLLQDKDEFYKQYNGLAVYKILKKYTGGLQFSNIRNVARTILWCEPYHVVNRPLELSPFTKEYHTRKSNNRVFVSQTGDFKKDLSACTTYAHNLIDYDLKYKPELYENHIHSSGIVRKHYQIQTIEYYYDKNYKPEIETEEHIKFRSEYNYSDAEAKLYIDASKTMYKSEPYDYYKQNYNTSINIKYEPYDKKINVVIIDNTKSSDTIVETYECDLVMIDNTDKTEVSQYLLKETKQLTDIYKMAYPEANITHDIRLASEILKNSMETTKIETKLNKDDTNETQPTDII